MKFNLKDRVVIREQVFASYGYNVGTVIAYADDGSHIVEFLYGNCAKVNGDCLVTETEAKEIQDELNAKQAKLDAEFTKVSKQIQKKLNRAAELIRESNTLACDHNKNLYSLYEENSDLVDVLSDVGWISSSSNC